MDTAEDDLSGLREAGPAVALSKGKGRAVRMRAPRSLAVSFMPSFFFFLLPLSFIFYLPTVQQWLQYHNKMCTHTRRMLFGHALATDSRLLDPWLYSYLLSSPLSLQSAAPMPNNMSITFVQMQLPATNVHAQHTCTTYGQRPFSFCTPLILILSVYHYRMQICPSKEEGTLPLR